MDGRDEVYVHKVVDAIYESARTQQVVKVG